MRAGRVYTILAWVQGVYILLTALWGLVDIDSFMLVTGPKTDIWLVKTVSVLLIPISLCFFFSIIYKLHQLPIILFAITTSAGLAFIDFYYTSNHTIKWVYAVDGVIEVIFLIGWVYLLFVNRK